MMGKDCERIIKLISDIEETLTTTMINISKLNSPPIIIDGTHSHDKDGNSNKLEFIEKDTPVKLSGFLSELNSMFDIILPDLVKMNRLETGLYTDPSSFNNSLGSPWTEISKFKSAIESIKNSTNADYVGNRLEIITLMNIATTRACDAKWAMLLYHDYVQRGFDAKYNDKLPSIAFKQANKKDESIGNIRQDYDENVNIPKKPIDPW